MNYVSAGLFTVFMVLAAYNKGLFFNEDFYKFHLFLYASNLIVVLYMLLRGKLRKYTKGLVLLAAGLIYMLQLLFGVESVKGTIDQALRFVSYGSFFFLLYSYSRRKQVVDLLHYSYQSIGYFVVIGAFLGLYGVLDFKDVVLVLKDPRLSTLGVRLSGFFQYANTFAVVIGSFYVYHLLAVARDRRIWAVVYTAFPLVLYFLALLLSESRGAWIATAIGWFCGLCLFEVHNQLRYLSLTVLTAAGGLISYRGIAADYAAGTMSVLWPVMILLLSILVVAAALILQKRPSRGNLPDKRRLSMVIPGIVLVIGLVSIFNLQSGGTLYHALPDTIQKRVSVKNVDTALARKMFYQDAVTIVKESPLVGHGGGAWQVLFGRYQQQPYVGNDVHSSLFNLLLEIGIIGTVVLLTLFLFIFRVIGLNKDLAPPMLILAGHSLIDLDFSYGFVWFLVVWLLILGAREEEKAAVTRLKSKTHDSTAGPRRDYILTGVAVGLVTVALIFAFRFERAAQAFEVSQSSDQTQAGINLESAVNWDPYQTSYRVEFGQMIQLFEPGGEGNKNKLAVLLGGVRYEPNNPLLNWEIGLTYSDLGVFRNFITYMDRSIKYDRYDTAKQEKYLETLDLMARKSWQSGQKQQARVIARKATVVFNQYAGLEKDLNKRVRKVNDRDFRVTDAAVIHAAEAYLLLGQYRETLLVLQSILGKDHAELWAEAAAYAVVANQKLGNNKSFYSSIRKEVAAEVANKTAEIKDFYGT